MVYVVGATGFEPAASRSQSGRSTKLSYAPKAQPVIQFARDRLGPGYLVTAGQSSPAIPPATPRVASCSTIGQLPQGFGDVAQW